MTSQIYVPLKKTLEIDLEAVLKDVLPSDLKDGGKTLKDLDKLRKDIVSKKGQKTVYYLEQLCKYHDQIAFLASKYPEELKNQFTWEDAFSKAYVFSGKPTLALPFLGYEKHCILFNIAALQSQLAVESSNVDTDEERKTATKYYQSASGIFESLKPSETAGNNLTPDFHPDLLTSLSSLMLAQAQEMFVTKAFKDKMKDGIIAKLCVQTADMFSQLLSIMTRDTVKYIWDKAWLQNVKGKSIAYGGLANYFQSRVCASKKLIGEEISRLNDCIENLKRGQDKVGDSNFMGFFVTEAKRLQASAIKDNDFIYHEPVPSLSTVPTIPCVASAKLAKMTPVQENMAADYENPFESLLKPPEPEVTAVIETPNAVEPETVVDAPPPVAPPRKKKTEGSDTERSDSPQEVKEPEIKKEAAKNGRAHTPSWNQVLNDSWSLLKPYLEEIVIGKK